MGTTALQAPDFYRLLQVDPAAEPEVIRAAYRTLAAKHHPDIGGSTARMIALNGAWSVLSDPATRSEYDRDRRLMIGRDRWDAYAPVAPPAPTSGAVLEFGRFAGWSVADVARHDPNYLEWLARTPNGRRYRAEIDEVLDRSRTATETAPVTSRKATGGRWRRR
jgi:curved DNA-binding protein CbpA